MMRRGELLEVSRLCREVDALAQDLIDQLGPSPSDYTYEHPTLSGTLRRRSMDLTRALARLRKP